MQYRVEGIVIRSMDYGENNKIITVYTNTNGKVGIVVRGAKKAKSRMARLRSFSHMGNSFIFGIADSAR